MKRGLMRHRKDLVSIVLLVIVAMGVVAYILSQQPAFHPPGFLRKDDKNPFIFSASFTSAAGVIAGQGQTIDIAGVPIGQVRSVDLENGNAVITFRVKRKYAPKIYKDATLLIRPKTALKDLYMAMDPGHPEAGRLTQNGRIPVGQTQPDVNADEILGNLDDDTRTYLNILLGNAAQALREKPDSPAGTGAPSEQRVADLRGIQKRFEPLAAHGRTLFGVLGERRANLRRAVHALNLVSTRIGDVDGDLANLIDVSDKTFSAFAAQDSNLRQALREFPSALQETDKAVTGLTQTANLAGPTFARLIPFANSLGPSLRATRPFFRDTTPVLRTQIRPLTRDLQPVLEEAKPSAKSLAKTVPHLDNTVGFLNRFFNAIAYNPPGSEEGYLFWGSWLAHLGPSLLNTQDAHGAIPRSLVLFTCPALASVHQVELGNPSLGPILRLINLPDQDKYCPDSNPFGTR